MADAQNQTSVRCAIYLRSATGDRASLHDQEEACHAAAARHEPAWTIDDDLIFTDSGSPGTDGNSRPGLAALLERTKEEPRSFDQVLVASADRLGRNLAMLLQTIDFFAFHGIHIHIASTGLDSRDPSFRRLLLFESEYEDRSRRAHSEKVRRGQLGAFLKGRSLGGRQYGYRGHQVELPVKGRTLVQGARLIIDDEEAEVVRAIFSQFAGGLRITEIAHRLNERGVPGPDGRSWNVGSIRRILRNNRYRGTLAWNRTKRLRNPYTGRPETRQRPPEEVVMLAAPELRIVDDELAARVDARL